MRNSSFFAALALGLTTTGLMAQEVTIKVSHFLPPNSNYQKLVLEPWCAKLATDSCNKLKCQIYPAMQLGGTPPSNSHFDFLMGSEAGFRS